MFLLNCCHGGCRRNKSDLRGSRQSVSFFFFSTYQSLSLLSCDPRKRPRLESIPSHHAENLDDALMFGRNRWSFSSVKKKSPGEEAPQRVSVLVLHLPRAGRSKAVGSCLLPNVTVSDRGRWCRYAGYSFYRTQSCQCQHGTLLDARQESWVRVSIPTSFLLQG